MVTSAEEVKYPIGIQNFAELREGGYLYIDKTAYISRLFNGKYYSCLVREDLGKASCYLLWRPIIRDAVIFSKVWHLTL